MTEKLNSNKTLAEVQPGGRVRLGDADPIRSALEDALQFVETLHSTVAGDSRKIVWRCLERGRAALSAQPFPGGQGDAPLRVFSAGRWTYDGTGQSFSHEDMDGAAFVVYRDAALAARQPVGEPVTDAGRSAAYDAIDRFLRNNMDDEAYAAYVEHLEALWAAVPAQAVNTPQPVAFDYPKFHAVGMGCVLEDRGVHFLIDAAQCGFDEALGQMKATLESIGPLYTAPPAQAVDLDMVERAMLAHVGKHATRYVLDDLRALIDSRA